MVVSAGIPVTVEPDASAVSFTGYAPTIDPWAGFTGYPNPGSPSFTGYVPTLSGFDTDIDPSVGTMAFSGHQPAIDVSGDTILEPLTGELDFTGLVPVLGLKVLLSTIATESYVAVGAGVDLSVDPSTGSLAFTGYVPQIFSDIAPGVGALSFTGYVPATSRTLYPSPPGALVFTGLTPDVDPPASPGVAALSFNGLIPTLDQSVTNDYFPAIGEMSFLGHIVDARQTIYFDIPTGALLLSGHLPSSSLGVFVAVAGTMVPSVVPSDITTGGKAVIFTLTGSIWAASLGGDNAITSAFLLGGTSSRNGATQWNNVVRDNLTHTALTRDNDTQVTLLLPAFGAYSTTVTETIQWLIPLSAIENATEAVLGSPPFAITVASTGVGGSVRPRRRRWRS
jgi:hypothetical protein